MALWKPNETVGKNESIGRRLFQRQGLKGAKDQKRPDRTFELYHFEENRDREVSIDRLGATSIDRKVKVYLNPRGHHAAARLHKSDFQGWAATKAKELQSPAQGSPLEILSLPIAEQDDSHDMAIRLKYIFERNYHLEPCIPLDGRIPPPPSKGLFRRLTRWFWPLWN